MGEHFIRSRAQRFKFEGDRALRSLTEPNLWSSRPEVLVVEYLFEATSIPAKGAVLTLECCEGGVRAIDGAIEVAWSADAELRSTLDVAGSVAAAEVVEVSSIGSIILRICEEKKETP
jgi:hypothetical protein